MCDLVAGVKEIALCAVLPKSFDCLGIYGIRHKLTRRYYVGSSVNVRSRIWVHRRALKNGLHHSRHLQAAFDIYGKDEFVIVFIQKLKKIKDLIPHEQYWIDKLYAYKNGFNARPIADANYGIKWTDDQNAARKKSCKETWSDPGLRKKHGEQFKGIIRGVQTKESRNKISESLRAAHKKNPEWAKKTVGAIHASKELNAKRVAGLRRSLKDPMILEARKKQLSLARQNPKRLKNLRQTYFDKYDRSSLGVKTDDELTELCARLYVEEKLSLRAIGRQLNMDHKSASKRIKGGLFA